MTGRQSAVVVAVAVVLATIPLVSPAQHAPRPSQSQNIVKKQVSVFSNVTQAGVDAPAALVGNSNPAIQVRVKALRGKFYVFASNTGSVKTDATFTWRGPLASVVVDGERRRITPNGTTFSDGFRPYETHLYVVAEAPSGAVVAAATTAAKDPVSSSSLPDGTVQAVADRPVAAAPAAPAGYSKKFAGARVRVVVTWTIVNVRKAPSFTGAIISTAAKGTSGTVTGGPVLANGVHWWTVAYDTGVTGWSIEDALDIYKPAVATAAPPPTPQPAPATAPTPKPAPAPATAAAPTAAPTPAAPAPTAPASTPTPAPVQASTPPPNPAAGTWVRIAATIKSVLPSPLPDIGFNSPEAITTAWSSGALDTKRGRLYVLGGGHADYSGNEVYQFDLATGTWSRLTEPSPWSRVPHFTGPNPRPSVDAYDDSTPASVHTYGMVQYIPTRDALYLGSDGSRWHDGEAMATAWLLDLATKTWTRFPRCGGDGLGMTSAYDAMTNRVIIRGITTYRAQDMATGTCTRISAGVDSSEGSYDGHSTAIHAGLKRVVSIGAAVPKTGFVEFDLNKAPTEAAQLVTMSGDTDILAAYAPGIDYDSKRQMLVAYAGGSSVYNIDLAARKITKVSVGGVVPPAQGENGTFGRWRYVASQDAFIYYNSINDGVYLYRPGASTTTVAASQTSPSPTSPSPTPSPSPAPAAPTPPVTSPSPAPSTPPPANTPAPVVTSPPPTLSSPPSTSRTAQNLPPRTWVPFPMQVKPRPGMGYYASWFIGGKHGRAAFNTLDQRIYFFGGDWYSYDDPVEDGNGNSEMWSYSVANNDWRKETTYCGNPGEIVPARADESTWVYDSKRNLFYAAPGFWFGVDFFLSGCPNKATPQHTGLVWNPGTKKWSATPFPPPQGSWGGDNDAKSGVYDPVSDSLIRFRVGPVLERLNLATNTWTITRLPAPADDVYVEQDPTALDVTGRNYYGIDYSQHRLVRYNIDSNTAKTWPLPASYAWDCTPTHEECFDSNNGNLVFDPGNRVLLMPNMKDKGGRILKMFIFHVDTESWEEEDIVQPPGTTVNGNTAVFDPVNNAMMLIGGRISPYFFLYRYR